jgi:hypothetical protein
LYIDRDMSPSGNTKKMRAGAILGVSPKER